MDIRGLVLVTPNEEESVDPMALSPLPLALVETAGRTPLQRMNERLRRLKIEPATAFPITAIPPRSLPNGNGHVVEFPGSRREHFWRSAAAKFEGMIREGAELVVVVSLGAYAEVDFEELVHFHLKHRSHATQVCSGSNLLEVFCVSAPHPKEAATLFRSLISQPPSGCPLFEHSGYTNLLADARNLRQFAIDILKLKTETRAAGTEIKPGVWIESGAVIEKGARLLAPGFVGHFAKVRAGAVVTRCSSVEHHAEVDCGTVVENSSVLPYSYIGAGLDLAHSVVGSHRIVNLRRNLSIEVADPKLVARVPVSPSRRLVNTASQLVIHLPRQIWHGLAGAPQSQLPEPSLQSALHQSSPASASAAGFQAASVDVSDTFSPNLAVARRYGNQ